MRTVRLAVLVAFASVACLVLVAVATQAAGGSTGSVGAYGDPATTFRLTGTTLTVSTTDPVVLDAVRGRRLTLGCDGVPWCPTGSQRTGLPPAIGAVWGEHASSVTFDRVPAHVSWVALYTGAGGPALFGLYVSDAAFTPAARAQMRKALGTAIGPAQNMARQNLRNENRTIQTGLTFYAANRNRFGLVSKYPAAPRIAKEIDELCVGTPGPRTCAKPNPSSRTPLLYAPTLAAVTQADRAYVVGTGTSAKTLELANIGLDRKLYILRAKPNALFGTFSPAQPS
jgi:hypothetical protein